MIGESSDIAASAGMEATFDNILQDYVLQYLENVHARLFLPLSILIL